MIENELPAISLSEYKYDLPEEKIAKFPLSKRDSSKLLVYKSEIIEHTSFSRVVDYLPEGTSLFFNDTRVIPARLHFKKDTGAHIEIFLLEPLVPTRDVAQAMLVKASSEWKCMVGNFKKWKSDQTLTLELPIEENTLRLQAHIVDRENQVIGFSWEGDHSFVEIIQAAGKIPLPPYINRDVDESDKERYQTVYSHHEGAVAAPTAGLHFSDEVLSALRSKNIALNYLTLHVSAGTFQPVKEENVLHHAMHSEQVVVTLENITSIISNPNVVAVGTTSMRTLESLYWYGVKLLRQEDAAFTIEKLFPYTLDSEELPTAQKSFGAIKAYMERHNLTTISGHTEIFIFPGYDFKVCRGLITNYHLPGSTLILLVAAFIGQSWRKVYQEALDNEYRFLSYGDSSLLWRDFK